MGKFTITVNGCDDSTKFVMELTEEEAMVVGKLCELSEETSTSGCMPTVSIESKE